MGKQSADQVWRSIRSDDKKSLEWIYDTYSERMLGYGLSLFKNRDLVKDGIQDVFVELWKYRKNLEEIDRIKPYLFKSLRAKIYRNLKSDKHQLETTDMIHIWEKIEGDPPHESTLINKEKASLQQQKLYMALEKLPPREKEALRHIFFENLSYEETSFVMGMNIRSVYTLAWKAISRLKKHIVIFLTCALLMA